MESLKFLQKSPAKPTLTVFEAVELLEIFCWMVSNKILKAFLFVYS